MGKQQKKRAVAYTRIASRAPEDQRALGAQHRICTEMAGLLHASIEESFTDTESANRLDRPGLNDLFTFVLERGCDYVICTDMHRLARSHEGLLSVAMRLQQLGVRIALADTQSVIEVTTHDER